MDFIPETASKITEPNKKPTSHRGPSLHVACMYRLNNPQSLLTLTCKISENKQMTSWRDTSSGQRCFSPALWWLLTNSYLSSYCTTRELQPVNTHSPVESKNCSCFYWVTAKAVELNSSSSHFDHWRHLVSEEQHSSLALALASRLCPVRKSLCVMMRMMKTEECLED